MTNAARNTAALLCGLMCATPACAWADARPSLVLQLSRVTRARATPEAATRAQDIVFSAAISMAMERPELDSQSVLLRPATQPTPYLDIAAPDATRAADPTWPAQDEGSPPSAATLLDATPPSAPTPAESAAMLPDKTPPSSATWAESAATLLDTTPPSAATRAESAATLLDTTPPFAATRADSAATLLDTTPPPSAATRAESVSMLLGVSPPSAATELEPAATQDESSALSCERSPPLCAWARTSEQAALTALLEMREVGL